MIEVSKQSIPLNQCSDGKVNLVDFGIGILRGIREIKSRQLRGEISSDTYIYISQDLYEIVEDTIESLLSSSSQDNE